MQEQSLTESSQFPFSQMRKLKRCLNKDKEFGQGHVTRKVQSWALNLGCSLWRLPRCPFGTEDSSQPVPPQEWPCLNGAASSNVQQGPLPGGQPKANSPVRGWRWGTLSQPGPSLG